VNTEAEEATALKAVTRRQPVKIQKTEKNSNCSVCELALELQLFVITFCKSSINPITNLNPVYSHTQSLDNWWQKWDWIDRLFVWRFNCVVTASEQMMASRPAEIRTQKK
jgi:hypothetical protein